MASSDAFVIGEDWISEHYFTTDAKSQSFQAKILERRKAWDEADEGVPTIRSRFTSARGRLEASLAALLAGEGDGDSLPELYADLREILGYHTGEYSLKTDGPVVHVSAPDIAAAAPLAIIEAKSRRDRRGPPRQGRRQSADPVRGRREDHGDVGGSAAVHALRRRGRARVRPGDGGALAAGRRAGPLGRGPLPRHRPAAGVRTQRRQARR